MLQLMKYAGRGLMPVEAIEPGCWINMVEPDAAEIERVRNHLSAPAEFFTDPLDVDERARYEVDGDWTLIIIRIPFQNEKPDASVPFVTIPLGIIHHRDFFVTICTRSTQIISDLIEGRARKSEPSGSQRLIFHLLLNAGLAFLKSLRRINSKTEMIEKELQKSMRNQDLAQLLDLEKSLVYFTTSLKSNELVMERLKSSRLLKNDPDMQELYDDVVVEMRQAIAMANIYSDILSGMMDAFASMISNNLNVVMKFLTSITIILMLPTLVVSIYGMNIPLPFQHSHHAFMIVIGISVLLAVIGALVFIKRGSG